MYEHISHPAQADDSPEDAVDQAGLGGDELLTSEPITAYFAPARAWLRSTWRSAGHLRYDMLPSAGADVADPSQGSQSPGGFGGSGPLPSGAWAWLERTWRSAMALGYETLPVAAAAGDDEDLDAASAAPAVPMAGPSAGYTQALQAAGGAVVLDARPGDGVGFGPGSLGDGASARWHRPGRLFAGALDPARDPASELDPERVAAAALAADVAEHGLPAPSSAWHCVRAWLHRVLDPSPAAYPGQGDEDPADGLQEDGAPAERAEAHDFPALLHDAQARLAEAEAAVDAGRAQDVSSPFYVEAHDLPTLVAAARKRLADAEAAVAAAEAAAGPGTDRVADPYPGAFARWHNAALAVVGRELEARAAGSMAAARSRPRPVSASRGPTPVRLLIRLPAAAQPAGVPALGEGVPDTNPAGQTLSQALDSALAAARASGSQPGLESPVGHVTLRLRLRGGSLPLLLPQVAQTRVRVVPGVADMGAPVLLSGHGPKADASVSGTA